MGNRLDKKQLVLIGFVLCSAIIGSLFQNCASKPLVKIKPPEVVKLPAPPTRAPASNLSEMISNSDREIRNTRAQLDQTFNHDAGYAIVTRKVANRDDIEPHETRAQTKVNFEIKLKSKKSKVRRIRHN